MISLLLIALEGLFNSVMDTLTHHYPSSVFKNWGDFWNPAVSWRNKYILPKWIPDVFTDGWHLVKLLHICSFLLAVVFYEAIFQWWILDFLLLGIVRNLVFVLFYDKIWI